MKRIFYFVSCCLVLACSDSTEDLGNEEIIEQELQGTGFFEYSGYEPFADKTIPVYYHVPEDANSNTPILFIFHGNSRNAFDYRNALIDKSNEHNFVIICPRFSSQDFPGGDVYNLGNVYVDGDNPQPSELNPTDEWTFSVIEPLFDEVKQLLNSEQESYDIFGHSAGGQFAHRFMLFRPDARFNRVLISAPGWYTTLDSNLGFPYGLSNSILEDLDLDLIYNKDLTLLIGELDNDPNAGGLRRNSTVDLQGTNRFDRALHFFNQAQQQASNASSIFNWHLEINAMAGHDYRIAASKAADILFD